MKIKIRNKNYPTITRYADPNDQWDCDDINNSIDILGIEISNNSFFDLEVPFDVVPNKQYYLVYASYNTGDSFHHESNCVEYIELFSSLKKAQTLANLLSEDYKNFPDFFDAENAWNQAKKKDVKLKKPDFNTVLYPNELGVPTKYYTYTWKGYFESLNYIKCIPVSLI